MNLDDPAEVVGCEYVMRGAALGGRVIFAMVSKNLGVSAQDGGQFFYGDGKQTSENWSVFQAKLSCFPGDGLEADHIVLGAIKTFSYFEKVLGMRSLPARGLEA
jgi:heme oxygenase